MKTVYFILDNHQNGGQETEKERLTSKYLGDFLDHLLKAPLRIYYC